MKVPEYTPADAPEHLVAALENLGILLLRRAFAPELIESWLPTFLAAYAEYDRLHDQGQLDPRQVQILYNYGHVRIKLIERFDQWLMQIVHAPPLQAFLRAYFGAQAWILLNNCSPRREGPGHPEHAIPFHQDQEFMGPMQRALNLWLPLTPAGGQDWPGLEFWLGGPRRPWLALTMPPADRERLCRGIPPEELWRPELAPGDMLLFTPYVLHRTYLSPAMTQTRISSEIRLISPQDVPLTRSQLIRCDF